MVRNLIIFMSLCWAFPSMAAPRVVTSILPLHSLVSGVMDGVGEPQLLIGANASPHAYALKPSDARKLSEAQLIVWVGEGLEAMLEQPLRNLAGSAQVLELSTLKGMQLLPTRKGGAWQMSAQESSQAMEHDGHDHAQHRSEVDTHLWLSPANARLVISVVAEQLSGLDVENATQYRANASAMERRIGELEINIDKQLAPLRERPYIVFHDAYHYFEEAFGLHPVGAIAVSPERRPGARRLVEIREAIRSSHARCVFSEPQFRADNVKVVLEGSRARHGVLDPLGTSLAPGKEQWFSLMLGLADSLVTCLNRDS